MSFLHAGTSSEVTHSGASPSSPSLPSEGGGVSGCPSVASRGSSSPPARLLSSVRGGGASGHSFGARELVSVSSVHSWTGEAGVALLHRTPATLFCPGWFSLLISARPARWWGGSLWGLSLFLVAFPASSLHTLQGGEAGESLSSAPVRILPWLPDLRLGKSGRCFESALGRMALVIGLVAHAVAPLSVLGWAVVTVWA